MYVGISPMKLKQRWRARSDGDSHNRALIVSFRPYPLCFCRGTVERTGWITSALSRLENFPRAASSLGTSSLQCSSRSTSCAHMITGGPAIVASSLLPWFRGGLEFIKFGPKFESLSDSARAAFKSRRTARLFKARPRGVAEMEGGGGSVGQATWKVL